MKILRCKQRFGGVAVAYTVYTPADKVQRRAAFACSPLCDALCWDKLCRALCADGVLCVVCELPGFGTTPVNAPQDNVTRARVMWGVLDEVDFSRGDAPGKWHLVSHGSACGVILEMTRRQNESVLSRTLINPVTDKFTSGLYTRFLASRLGRKCLEKVYAFRAGNVKRFREQLNKLYGSEVSEKRAVQLHKEFYRKGRIDTLFSLIEVGYRIPRKAYLEQGHIMLIWGKEDSLFGDRPPEALLKRLPDTELHLVHGAHMLMETMPDEMKDYLTGWFSFSEGKLSQVTRKKL